MPIDFYCPAYFNDLPAKLRNTAEQTVGLLPDAALSFRKTADELLDDEHFMEKFGAGILAQYDLDNGRDWVYEGEEGDDDDDDDDDDETLDGEGPGDNLPDETLDGEGPGDDLPDGMIVDD